jgi:hypothetical protein
MVLSSRTVRELPSSVRAARRRPLFLDDSVAGVDAPAALQPGQAR